MNLEISFLIFIVAYILTSIHKVNLHSQFNVEIVT